MLSALERHIVLKMALYKCIIIIIIISGLNQTVQSK